MRILSLLLKRVQFPGNNSRPLPSMGEPGKMPGRLLAALVLFCTIGAASLAQEPAPRYEMIDCPEIVFWMAYDEIDAVSCGMLHVPADRALGADSPMLQLFVLRLAALHDRGNAPIVHLEGGPGGAASSSLEDSLFSALRIEHELILIDQRGTGLSLPSLNCPEKDEATSEDPLAECRARLVESGIDLTAFNTAANARDVHDLLVALDLPTANIYGISYGTRLALALARDFPGRLRAIILDGVSPPQARVITEQAANGNLAFEQLFADCAASPTCSGAYPDLRERFDQVIDRLSEEPAEIIDLQSGEATMMNSDIWVNAIFALLYDTNRLPWLPALISAHAAGEYDFQPPVPDEMALPDEADMDVQLPDFLVNYDDDSEGMHYSVICAEDVPFDRADDVIAAGAQLPPRIDAALTKASLQTFDLCRVWNVPAADASTKQPVVSDIPTLLFSGAYDPITPPAWAEAAAQSLSASWHLVFPAAGHGALGSSDCADQIALDFFNQPTVAPNSSCIEALRPPDFQS